MKKYIVFIITIIGILLFQSCIEGYLSYYEETEKTEKRCEIRESNSRETFHQDVQTKGVCNHSFCVVSLSFFGYCDPEALAVCPRNSLSFLSRLFNHSPPAMTSFAV